MAADQQEKRLYRIGEVSRLTGVNPHVLRYWERELPQLAPNRTLSRQRYYRPDDIERIRLIKRLLVEERYTLDGVRRILASQEAPQVAKKDGWKGDTAAASPELLLQELLQALREIRNILA